MISHRRPLQHFERQTQPGGLTLAEMLLVLTVLGVIAAIMIPNISRLMADQKIQEATEMVRTHLAGTRYKAIDAVLIYEFRYELGGNRFLVIPNEPTEFPEGDMNAQGQLSGGDQLYRYAGMLRTGVVFTVTPTDASNLGIPVIEESVPVADWQLQGLAGADELRGAKWSNPLKFYPDGSADQSVLRLEDENGQQMEITLRGLTAAVSAMPVREGLEL